MEALDKPLWPHMVRFDEAFRGLSLTLVADDERRDVLKQSFGMIELHDLTANITTRGVETVYGDTVEVRVVVKGSVTQECGVSLEPFRQEIEADIDLVCALKPKAREKGDDVSEVELRPDDLDQPDLVENGQIDVGQYVIEALGEAYDPFARKPGVVFEEPQVESEPSPFAVLAQLKRDK